jgi:hypothetical protein
MMGLVASTSGNASVYSGTSLDPERFASLPEPLVWSEAFVLAEKQS